MGHPRGYILEKVLNGLTESTQNMSDLFCMFLSVRYGASISEMEKKMRHLRSKRGLEHKAPNKRDAQYFYNFINRLKHEGFISLDETKTFSITPSGKNRLQKLTQGNDGKVYPVPKTKQKEFGGYLIISFDIPENKRYKRNWLRQSLLNMDFKMIQKSVWLGRVKLPAEFFEGVKTLEISKYIEIFEIKKAGSLRLSKNKN